MRYTLTLFIIILAISAFGQGASQEEIKAAVKRLGAESFRDRQKASDFLWRQGIAARKQLDKAVKSKDPEIRMRAKKVLKKINTGIFPDTPQELVLELEKFDSLSNEGKTILFRKMINLGERGWTSLHFLIENRISSGDLDLWPFKELLQNKEFLLKLLERSPKWDGLIESMLKADFINGNLNNYLAWIIQSRKLKQKIAEFEKLAKKPRGEKYLKMLAFMYRANNQLKKGRETAEQAGIKWLAFRIALEMEDYVYCLKKANNLSLNGNQDMNILAIKASLLNLNGQEKESEELIKQLFQSIQDEGFAQNLDVEALIINEKFQQASELNLKKAEPDELLITSYQQRAGDYIKANEKHIKAKGEALLPYIGFLHFHGEKDRANKLFQQVAEKALKAPENSHLFPDLIALAIKLNHPMKNKLIKSALNNKEVTQKSLISSIAAGSTFWWNYIEMKYPQENFQEQLKRFWDLKDNMPKGDAYIELLKESSELLNLLPKTQQTGKRFQLAHLYKYQGKYREELAELLKTAKLNEHPFFLTKIGDWYVRNKDWQKAVEWYEKTLTSFPADPLSLMLLGNALIESGKEEEGRKKIKIASLLTLGNLQGRTVQASQLEKRDLNKLALQEYELVKNLEFFNSWYLIRAYQMIPPLKLKLNKNNVLDFNYFRLASLEFFSPNIRSFSSLFFLRNAFQYRLFKGKELFAKKQYQKAAGEFRKAGAVADINLDKMIEVINDLSKLGLNKEADSIYQQEKKRYQDNLQLLPKSSDYRNSLAWLMSKTHRNLKEALKLSREAVEKSPENAAYLDTLAEVYFHLKDREQAVKWQKKALEHVHDQDREFMTERLKRFQNDPFPENPLILKWD